MFTLNKKHYLLIILIVILNGCSTSENSNINQKKIKSTIQSSVICSSSISHSNDQETQSDKKYLEPLFEDYKPRNIGDMLTVILQENMSASNNISNNSMHHGNSNLGISIGNTKEYNPDVDSKLDFNTSIKHNFLGKGGSSANNKFVGLITVTVKKVFSNGNLEVSGEKNITINDGGEKINFYGIVNPRTISKNNSVLSTQIANTNITYISSGPINQAGKVNWLQRLFLNMFTLSK